MFLSKGPSPPEHRATLATMPLAERETALLFSGLHQHPFSILGFHEVPQSGRRVLRLWSPGSVRIEILLSHHRPARRIHPEGLFECVLPVGAPAHPVRIRSWSAEDTSLERYDAYTFPVLLSDYDRYLMGEGTHYHSYKKLGAHAVERAGVEGIQFAVWAPNASSVSLIGDFNDWHPTQHPMEFSEKAGVWQLFVPGVGDGNCYKYLLRSGDQSMVEKVDPHALLFEIPPRSASVTHHLGGYDWNDESWLNQRLHRNSLQAPVSVYEVHSGSWGGGSDSSYRNLARELVDYVEGMGFTHIEFLPLTEHPYEGSWGYQTIGYFAPTSRFGEPDDFRYLVDCCHQRGIGVFLDWVPAHFAKDVHGLARFDGTCLYEHPDPRRGEQPNWGTLAFDLGRNEVCNFLISSALFWLQEFHLDGLRVDAVASMLYLDYSRQEGEWLPNIHGGRENLEGVSFLRQLNQAVHEYHPDVLMIAEDSTAWPGVTRPVHLGGLGFDLKWSMGWMHDSLGYFELDPIHRSQHHQRLTFSMLYAFSENFLLPISHDEVVHGKGSLLKKQWGDESEKFAGIRVFLTYMYTHPGKKLLFMGCEFGQWEEWDWSRALDWSLLEKPVHSQLQDFVRELNRFYRLEGALHEQNLNWEGFEWVDLNDDRQSVISYFRKGAGGSDPILAVFNLTPVARHNYRLGIPNAEYYEEVLNSDSSLWGGSNLGNLGRVAVEELGCHRRSHSIVLTLPPLTAVLLKPVGLG